MTTVLATDIERINHRDAAAVALLAYDQLFDVLHRLEPHQWTEQTDCTRWDVAAMVGHLIGAGKSNAKIREAIRQQRWGKAHADEFGGNGLDAANELQVNEHAELSHAQRLEALEAIAPKAVRGRTRVPALVRAIRIPTNLSGGSAMEGTQAHMTVGELMDVIYTRDIWLHTVDVEQATGVKADRSGDIDRRIIHDAVATWMHLHGKPVTLHLTGSAEGSFRQGDGGPVLTMDGIEWARTVSGRLPGEGLLTQPVLF